MAERLPALISELSCNKSDGDRKKTKDRLQERFKACNVRVDQLLKQKSDCFSQIVGLSSKSISTIANVKAKCQDLKERLTTCKDVLRCKRDEIRRLWLESLQHKYAHEMMKEIEALRKIPEQVQSSILDGKYLHATDVLVFSVKLLDDHFGQIEALKELKVELLGLESKLYCALLEELRNELFVSNTEPYLKALSSYTMSDLTQDDAMKVLLRRNKAARESCDEMNADNSRIIVLSDCLSMLEKLPETVDLLKDNCRKELISIANKSSVLMHDSLKKCIETNVLELPVWNQNIFLLDLLETVLNIFRSITCNHKVFLNIFQQVSEVKGLGDLNYDIAEFYSKVQSAVEHFIGFYLDSQPLSTFPHQDASFFANSGNMSELAEFFLPRPQVEMKQSSLFKFRNSSHALEMKTLSLEGSIEHSNEVNAGSAKTELLCKPDLRNVIFIFSPLLRFTTEIENALGSEHGLHCPLHTYVLDNVNVFLDQINSEVNRTLESASANLEAWNISIVYQYPREKQILTSILILNNKLRELHNLMSYFPNYRSHFLNLIYYVVLDYKDLFQKVFKNLFEEEHNILSISWAKDRDIRRLLKSYSNWTYLQKTENNDTIEAPEEIRLRNKEESELLIRNLVSEDQSSWEVIRDFTKLSNIALLEESLEWFCKELASFTDGLPVLPDSSSSAMEDSESKKEGERCSQNTVNGFKKLLKEYQDFADMCLLALHLEVRAYCFFHLLPFIDQESSLEGYFMKELDKAVKHLTTDLLLVDEILHSPMSVKEMKYIFEGLGELLSSILIQIISKLPKVTDSILQHLGRNIFVIQCCLANITQTREVSLERVRHYIDLFNLSFDEILSGIVEQGPRFEEAEYYSVFRLMSSNHEDSKNRQLEAYNLKLKHIFQRIPVPGQM